jgi:hypothetical protein
MVNRGIGNRIVRIQLHDSDEIITLLPKQKSAKGAAFALL